MDLLNFVDTRVTLNDHRLNQFIRNSVQLNFDELCNDLKMHIGTEGIQYRLVIHHRSTALLKLLLTVESVHIILLPETHDRRSYN